MGILTRQMGNMKYDPLAVFVQMMIWPIFFFHFPPISQEENTIMCIVVFIVTPKTNASCIQYNVAGHAIISREHYYIDRYAAKLLVVVGA